jgi:hypothetical protein
MAEASQTVPMACEAWANGSCLSARQKACGRIWRRGRRIQHAPFFSAVDRNASLWHSRSDFKA